MELSKGGQDLAALRLEAEEYFRINPVQEQLERALNELFIRRPSDLSGYLAEFFSSLSAPPRISRVEGLKVLDSRGQPSVQAQVYCIVRNLEQLVSSASVSSHFGPEDTQAKDRDEHVSNAVQWIQDLSLQLRDLSPRDQSQVDHILSAFYSSRLQEQGEAQSRTDDSTSTSQSNMAATPVASAAAAKKGKKGSAGKPLPPPEPPDPVVSGSAAVGALSLSVARAAATTTGVPLYQHLCRLRGGEPQIHVPSVLISVLSYGTSSPGKLNLFQEIVLVPKPGLSTQQVVSMAQELQREVLKMATSQSKPGISSEFLSDFGAPCLSADRPEQPLDLVSAACVNLNLSLGSDLFLALNCAAPNLMDYSKGKYEVSAGLLKSPDEMVELLQSLVLRYPSVVALIDPLRREDVEQWGRLSALLADSCSLLSDLTFRAQAPPPPGARGHVIKHANHVTVSELIRISAEQEGSVLLGPSYSEPSSEPSLPDLAVGLGHDFLKLGGLSGAERTSAYNRLICIEEELQRQGRLVIKEKPLPPVFIHRPEPEPVLDQDLHQDQEPSTADTNQD